MFISTKYSFPELFITTFTSSFCICNFHERAIYLCYFWNINETLLEHDRQSFLRSRNKAMIINIFQMFSGHVKNINPSPTTRIKDIIAIVNCNYLVNMDVTVRNYLSQKHVL